MGDTPNRAEVERRIAEMDAASVREQTPRRVIETPPERPQNRDETKPERKPEPAAEPVTDSARPAAQPTAPAEPTPRTTIYKGVGIALGVVAVGALASGIAMSVLASQASARIEKGATGQETFTADLHTTESHGKTYDVVGIVMYCAAGVIAGGSAMALYYGYRPEEAPAEQSPAAARRVRMSVRPFVSPTAAGLMLGGRF
jgi:hypothetical protein